MNSERTLVLVGPMGAGKSSVGRLLAMRWRVPFVDVDAEIERRSGMRITEIFERDGEGAFRALERDTLADLLAGPRCVLATGGGAVLDPLNRRRMREHGRVVYLHVGVDVQLRRLEGDRTRPLLAAPDRAAVLHAMAVERTPLYDEVAHFTINTDGFDTHSLAAFIGEGLEVDSSLQDMPA
jgi:shikimate kinase